MFKPKNVMISMAVVALLAACGGGGGNDDGTPNNNGNPTQPSGNNGNPSGGGNEAIAPTADAKLASGAFNLSGDNVLVGTGTAVAQLPYAEFVRGSDNPRDAETGYGLYGQELGTNAPLKSFGLALTYVPVATGTVATSEGRVAFELQDQTAGSEDPTRALRILVDKVTYSVDANDQATVTLSPESKAYVYAKNGADSATVTTTAAANLVSIVPNVDAGEPGRFGIVLNVDQAVTDALAASSGTQTQVLNSVKNFSAPVASPFKVSITYSNLDIERQGADLVGPTISVNGSGVAGVKDGSGATGYLQVGERPAAP